MGEMLRDFGEEQARIHEHLLHALVVAGNDRRAVVLCVPEKHAQHACR